MLKSPNQDADLFDLVDALYDCAIRPDGWSEVLRRMAEMMEGDAAGISLHSPAENIVRLTAHWNVDDDMMRAMEANIAINPAIPPLGITTSTSHSPRSNSLAKRSCGTRFGTRTRLVRAVMTMRS